MIEICDKHDCCGCTGCASVCGSGAITMTADEEGFLYPMVDMSLCSDCGLCERVCPIIARDKEQPASMPMKVLGLHNKNINTWLKSSSGGVFQALAEHTIRQEGIVFGAEYNDDFAVVHRGETTPEGILKFRGSKYVQSDLRGVYAEIRHLLRQNRKVMFSGVPCQVEGLKRFLIKSYDNLTTVDILCHGVPSPKIFSDYISYIRRNTVFPLKGIFMKDKAFGWGYQNIRLFYSKGVTEFNTPVSNLWNKIFYGHVANRPSCHACRFKNIHRAGDLSIGDFWGIEKSHPDFFSDKGVSLMLINTDKGMTLWNEIEDQFSYIESDTTECMQPVLSLSQPEPADRTAFWQDYVANGFEKAMQKRYNLSRLTIIKRNIRLFFHAITAKFSRI